MRVFGFEVRRFSPDDLETPCGGSARVYAYTPEEKVRSGYAAGLVILEHLMRGRSGSRRDMVRAGMSDTRWRRGVYLLQAAGVIAVTEKGRPLELTVKKWDEAEALLLEARNRLLANVRKPRYTLPFQ